MALYTLLKPFPMFTKIREYLPEVENLVSDSLEGIRLHGYIQTCLIPSNLCLLLKPWQKPAGQQKHPPSLD
jgi:hypothetical protein